MRQPAQHVVAAAALALVAAAHGSAQTLDSPTLSLEGARTAIAAAKAEALSRNAPGGVIAVVDNGGNLMALERLDGTFAAGANISVGKARTAARFKRSTQALEELINRGRTAMTALDDFTPLQGGVPILVDGKVVGGIGVSGAASAQQDEEVAMAGAAAVGRPAATSAASSATARVAHVAGDVVRAAFEKGMPLVETGAYKVHASRRDRDGQAEVHSDDTDILYVLDGAATLVTGGQVVDGRRTGEGELRGRAIAGGDTRPLSKGDLVIVPNGVPHLFTDVKGPFLYYVVKVTAARRES